MTEPTEPTSLIPYPRFITEALRAVPRDVLREIAATGSLPGEHHFYIEFDTTHDGVVMPDSLRARHPETMTIVLQHMFSGLWVEQEAFGVSLSFGGVPANLTVPFKAMKSFVDPAVQVALQFPFTAAGAETPDPEPEAKPESADESGGEVVRVDFSKKK